MLEQAKTTWRPFPPMMAMEECSICQGTGWEMMPTEGRATARRCPCVALSRSARLKERMCIPERHRHCTLESYHPRSMSQTRGLAEAWRFAEHFPDTDRGVVFVGRRGVGKTHLAVGIVLELARRMHEDILFVDFHSLPGVHGSSGGTAVHGDPAGSSLKSVSLLVLDDFGGPGSAAGEYQSALHVLRARLRLRKPTLCTGPGLLNYDVATEEGEPGYRLNGGGPRYVIHEAHALLFGSFRVVFLGGVDDRSLM